MPQIYINNNESNHKFSNLRNFSELIPSVKEKYLNENSYLYQIQVNGITITPENKLTFYNRTISTEDSINFVFIEKQELVHQIIDTCPKYADSILLKTSIAVELLKANEYKMAIKCLSEIIEKLDLFVQLITQLHRSLKISSELKLKSGGTIKELQIHLLSVIKAIHQAKKLNDEIMLTDLLEYELQDNLTRWKITAIPQIKRISSI